MTTTLIPVITEQAIYDLVGEQSFQRGQHYAREHAVFDERQEGMTLKARCHGSRAEAYNVEVTFDANGTITSTHCTCPVGRSCKHVAALLLTWLKHPEQFLEQDDIETILERYDKADLVDLLKHVIQRYPDVENLLIAFSKQPLSQKPEAYRRQIEAAFRRGYAGKNGEGVIADVQDIKDFGDHFAQQGSYADAIMVYESVVRGIIEQAPYYHHGYNDFHQIIDECIEALDACLEALPGEEELREKVFQILFTIYHYDIDMGGIGLGDSVPGIMLKRARAQERAMMAQWVREAIAGEAKRESRFRAQWYGGFLVDLEADELDDEAFLRICHETGRTYDAVKRLLELGRVDEAARETETAMSYEVLSMVDLFITCDYEGVAERIMRARAKTTPDMRVLEWLKDYYLAKKDYATALEFAEAPFRRCPSLERYRILRRLARKVDCWDQLREELLTSLRASHDVELLISIALDEKEIDSALSLLKSEQGEKRFDYYNKHGPIIVAVARVAEGSRPLAAIELYQQYVDHLIAMRGRENYRDACRYLKKIQALYEKLGQNRKWIRYIASLRDKNRNLRALKEELVKAQLS